MTNNLLTVVASFPPLSRIKTAGRNLWLLPLTLAALLTAAALTPAAPALPLGPTSADAAPRLIAPKRTCGNHSARGGSKQVRRARRSMLCMVRYARKKRGLRRYRTHRKLTWSAKRKARDILRCGAFSHGACGRKFDYWIKRSGYRSGRRGWIAGENIAWGNGRLGHVRSIFRAWMNSRGHRAAILDREFTDVNVGVDNGRLSGVGDARVWVLHFGHRY